MKFGWVIAVAAASGWVASPAVAKEKKLPKQAVRLLAMTPADYASSVALQDDGLEAVATFSTAAGFQEKRGLLGIVWSDILLRAFVNKATGATAYQVYFNYRGVSSSWPYLSSANYEGPGGLQTTPVSKLGSDVDCTGSSYLGGCTYTETVAFDFDEALARKVAAAYTPGGTNPWKMRFKGQSGINTDQFVMPAEMAGLLARVDAYRAEKGFSAAPSPAEPPAVAADPSAPVDYKNRKVGG